MSNKEQPVVEVFNGKVNNVPVRAHPMNLFPTMVTLGSVVELGISQLPIMTPNALVCLLMTYHNTLLATIDRESIIAGKPKDILEDRRITMDRRIHAGLPSNKE